MELFDNYYDDILSFANQVIMFSKIGRLDAYDLVNEAYLRCWESSDVSTLSDIKKVIKKIFFEEAHYVGVLYMGITNRIIGDEFCRGCKEVMPVAMFRTRTRWNGLIYLEDKCKFCENETATAYQKKHKKNAASTYKKYYAKNKELVQLRTKRWLEKEKEALSDKYIVRILQQGGKYKKMDIEANPDLIIQKREYLLDKYKKKNTTNTHF